jgi:hypothetical protein
MTTALGVAPDANGVGLDPLTHRLLIEQHWNNTGVVMGLTVSGRGDLRYQVSAGAAICSMSAADGYTEAYWNGGVTENAVDAGDSTYSRIDVVYMLSNTGTPDNVVHVMVQQGTPAASPAIPSLPAGGLPLAYLLMPSRGSTTNAATPYGNIDYAIQAGSSTGKLGENWDKRSFTGNNIKYNMNHEFPVRFTIPTDREIELVFDVNFSSQDVNSYSEWACGFEIDPPDTSSKNEYCIEGSTANFKSDRTWESHNNTFRTNVAAGTHTAYVVTWPQNGAAPMFHYGPNSDGHGLFVGRRFQVFDRNVAK